MKKAIRFFSLSDLATETVEAISVKSSSEARNLGPFVDEELNPVVWVGWSKMKANGKKNKPYFKGYPQKDILRKEIKAKMGAVESEIHKKARFQLKSYLQELIDRKEKVIWAFKDEKNSSFHLEGNLLAGVLRVETNYLYKTPYGIDYEFDIALLGKAISKSPIILGVVELEKTHSFGFLKALISKSLGFPLMAIDLNDFNLADITKDWCRKIIQENTNNSFNKLRRNYLYIHKSLYPIYLQIPDEFREENKHQFVVFCRDNDFKRLYDILKEYRKLLRLNDNEVNIQPVKLNSSNPSSITTFNNEGLIAYPNWKAYNNERYLRITLQFPKDQASDLYLYHLVISRLTNCYFDSVVGYKFEKGVENFNKSSNHWIDLKSKKIIAPKNVSEPISKIFDYLKKYGIVEK